MIKPSLMLAAATLVAATSSYAAANNWLGTTDSSWATATNWSTLAAPVSTDTVTYTGITALTQTLDGSYSVAGIAFGAANTTAEAYVLNNGAGANTLTLGSGGIDTTGFDSTDSLTINANIALNGAQTWKVINAGTAADLTVSGVISGSSALNLGWTSSGNGAGTIVLTGLNTYTGVTTILGSGTAGVDGSAFVRVTSIGNGGVAGNLGAATNAASNLVFGQNGNSAGELDYVGAGESTDRLFTLNGHAVIVNNGTGALNFTNTGAIGHAGGAHGLTLAGSNGGVFNPIIADGSGVTSFIKDGAGTWALAGTNTYTGSTTLSAGTLSVASIGNGGVAGNLGAATNAAANLVFNGGTLLFTGTSDSTDRNFTINAGKTASISVASGKTLAFGGSAGATTGGFLKDGVGQLTLSGANNWTGVTTIRGSNTSNVAVAQSVVVTAIGNGGVAGNLGAASNAAANLVFGQSGSSAGQLDYVGAGESTDRLFTLNGHAVIMNNGTGGALNFTNTGTIAHSGATGHALTLAGTNTTNNTLASAIANGGAGAVNLVKDNTGTWVVSGANTFTGGTTVSAGRLVTASVNALGAGNVSVSAAGTLQIGDGTADGVTLGAGATLATVTGATLKLGAASSQIAMTGAFTLAADTKLDVTGLNLTAGSYVLIAGTSAGSTLGSWNALSDLVGGAGGSTYSLAVSNNNLVLTVVPEPATYGLLGAGALAAAGIVRRRRRV